MVEKHPFGSFVPKNARYLILGSFVGKESTYIHKWSDPESWFYGSKRNQFWRIIEKTFNVSLPTKKSKEKLFAKHGIAIADIILQCERQNNSNLDNNLINKVYDIKTVSKIFKENNLSKVFFSSRAVEVEFKRYFKRLVQKYGGIELIVLPSPSPRFARMSFRQKVNLYKELFAQRLRDTKSETGSV